MNISVIKDNILSTKCDLLVVGLFKGSTNTGPVDKALDGLLSQEMKDIGFEAVEGELFSVRTNGKIPAKRAAVLGLGDAKKFTSDTARRAGGHLVRAFRGKGMHRVAAVLPGSGKEIVRAFVEGALLGLYSYDKYKSADEKRKNARGIKELVVVEQDGGKVRRAAQGVADAQISAAATIYARDLVNEPASVCVPSHLVEHARAIAKGSRGKVRVKIFDREEARRRGMGAFLAVAQGAHHEPRFIHLIYKGRNLPAGRQEKKIAIVGKGITFDSGGLQIKPGDSMKTMKCDMSGAAAVLGLFSKIVEIAPKAEVHGIIAATENIPGPAAYKPGDICRAMNGKTIEIGHTDAEGRVTMADSLSYAVRLKPDAIIDLATLTGACMVALGEDLAGLMTNNQKLGAKLRGAAEACGERMWELPLVEEYRGHIKSAHADIKNDSSVRYGGAITAGLFLQEFVNDIPWAHLDIAGPAWAERDTVPYIPKGGTGHGVRTLIKYLLSI